MHLNKLRDIKRIKGEHFKLSSIGGDDSSEEEEDPNEESKNIGAFDIDSKVKNGRLALIYRNNKPSKPQIWF